MADVSEIVEAIKGFGGYTTTASLWVLAGLTWWKGLPALLDVVEKIIDNWSKRRSAFEDRINNLLKDQETMYQTRLREVEERYERAEARHRECTEEQDRLRELVEKMSRENSRLMRTNAEEMMALQSEIESLRNKLKTFNLSTARVLASTTPTPEAEAALDRLIGEIDARDTK